LIPSGIGHFGAAKAGSDRKLAKAISISTINSIFIDFFIAIIVSSFLVLKIYAIFIRENHLRQAEKKASQRVSCPLEAS
jgi:hypothetical protein